MSAGDLSRRSRIAYIVILGLLTALGPFTIDMYLPALPEIGQQFGATEALVQMTLTGTLIGFALGQLIMGPLSDRVGRKIPLITAAVLHVAASVGAAMATGIVMLGLFRVLQGFGAAASTVITMAIIRDLFGGRRLVVMLSRLALVNGLAPVIAPVLGSQLLVYMEWPGIFWVLAVYGVAISLLAMVFIPETLPPTRRSAGFDALAAGYRALFRDRTYLGVMVISAMNYTALFAYLSASSFLFQSVYGLSAQQFGFLFAVNSVGIIIGVQTSARLMNLGKVHAGWILAGTTTAQILLSGTIVGLDLAGAGMWGTIIPLGFFIMAAGFTFPAIQYLALAEHGTEAGTAASLMGAVNSGLAGVLTPLIGLVGINRALPMAGLMFVAVIIGSAALWLIVRPGQMEQIPS